MFIKKMILTAVAACFTMSAITVLAEAPQIDAKAAYVMDADTGDEIYAKNAEDRMYPGGTTTIMTCILGLELGQNKLDQPLTITKNSQAFDSDVSLLGLNPGDKITLRHAMTGMMTASGCDAAVDVAETVSPTVADFVKAMNSKAASIGAVHTQFTNPTGLPDSNQYTTAHDMAKIASYGMKSADFRSMVNRKTYEMPYIGGGTKHCVSTNEFLNSDFSGANGVKTGYTLMGGPCLVASATQNGRTIVASVMNSENRFSDAEALLSYAFQVPRKSQISQSNPVNPVNPVNVQQSEEADSVYALRDAPAGQTLTQLAQEKASEITAQEQQSNNNSTY